MTLVIETGRRHALAYPADFRKDVRVEINWHAFGLEPHRLKRFKLSTDPFFVEKIAIL
jgi:hypothetical protein